MRRLALIAALLLAGGYAAAATAEGAAAVQPASKKTSFASQRHLEQHYDKHVVRGREFGSITREEYEARAVRLRDAAADGKVVHEHVRENGDRVKFDKSTGEFGVYREDGVVRTLFKPKRGWSYFLKQTR